MQEPKMIIFEKLTPTSDVDLGVYENALDFVFENDDVKNVAISGAYGAGKSSVLESYKKKREDKKYVHVSLAHFSEVENKENETVKESVLEGKILNQLIHQIPSNRIPQSNFKVKKDARKHQTILITTMVMVLFVVILALIFANIWKETVDSVETVWLKNILYYTTTAEARIFMGTVAIIVIGLLLYSIIQAQRNKHLIQRLSVQGNEIEIFEKSDESYFDKYLNEVLYLFENVDADVVVFEDMDRFEANLVFERLREVNTLANLQRKKEGKSILRFFYLLRDDIFISKDRTKFFDFIVPIVPVVDGSNSYNQFISHLKRNGLYERFDDGFLQGISLYIDEMRLLKNICNEFLIYFNRLNTTELDYNKMFALIAYKNLFPRDYGDLQLNKGFVHALFQKKQDIIRERKSALQKEIDNKKTEIEQIKKEQLVSIQELEIISSNKRNTAQMQRYGSGMAEFNKWQETEYPRRKGIIEKKEKDEIARLEHDIEGLLSEYNTVSSRSLKQIIARENIDAVFSVQSINEIGKTESFDDVKGNAYFDLLKFLVRNGYIDETYSDYMTYFYEDSLSSIDKIFLRSVSDQKAKDYSYELKSPKMVFNRLRLEDFDQQETLNNSLIDYMVQKEQKSEKLNRLVAQIIRTENYPFIEQLLTATTSIQSLIVLLADSWPSLFSEVLDKETMSAASIRQFSIQCLYYLNGKQIKAVNAEDVLTTYISSSPDYLDIYDPNVDKLIKGFNDLEVSFKSIDYSKSNRDLFSAVYRNGRYAICYQNILLILTKVFEIQDEEEIRHEMSTIILHEPDSFLAKRVKEDMDSYIAVAIAESNGRISDAEDVIIGILNDGSISLAHKQAYIQLLNTRIQELSAVQTKDLWRDIVAAKVAVCSEQNIIDYFEETGELDDEVVELINSAPKEFDFTSIGEESFKNKRELFKAFVKCDAIQDSCFKQAIPTFGEQFDSFDISNLSGSRMKALIDHDIIMMNKDSLDFIRNDYPDSLAYFIEHNIDSYIELMQEECLPHDELLTVLSLDIDDAKKIALLCLTKDSVSIKNVTYSTRVKEHILKNNLEEGDLPALFASYSNLEKDIQEAILNLASERIWDVIYHPNKVDNQLKDALMMTTEIDDSDRVELLIADMPNLSKDAAAKYLSIVGKKEFISIFDSHSRPRFEMNDQSRDLLEKFVDNGWIYEYYPEDGFYKIRRNPPRTR